MSTYSMAMFNCDLRPAYYDKFKCLMGGCQLNCCKDSWKIAFDRKDYLTLKNLRCSAELKHCLSHSLHRIKKGDYARLFFGEFDMSKGVCPLLREDNLCMLQLEKGTQVQPMVCKAFPRIEKYSSFGYFERSLNPACEGVLALLWDLSEGIDFISDPLPEKQLQLVPVDETGRFVSFDCQDIRSMCIDILQARQFSLPQRILLMGIILKELADGEPDITRWKQKAQQLLSDEKTPELLQTLSAATDKRSQARALSQNIHVLFSIGIPTSALKSMRQEIADALHISSVSIANISLYSKNASSSLPFYMQIRSRFKEYFHDKEYFMENLMVALFFQLQLPQLDTLEILWKSYVNFCNIYSFYRFMMVMSCRNGAAGDRQELFKHIVQVSRRLIHDSVRKTSFGEEFFKNDSATLAHMAVLLSI